MKTLALSLALITFGAMSLDAQSGSTLWAGGQVLPAFEPFDVDFGTFLYVDFAHPAAATIPANQVDLALSSGKPAILQFLVIRPNGSTYTVAGMSVSIPVNPGGASVVEQTVSLNPPLTFSRGDLLGVVSTTPLAITYADRPGGYAVFPSPTFNPNVGDTLPGPLRSVQRYTIAAAARGLVPFQEVPAAELLLPAVGDVQGVAHFVSRVDVLVNFPGFLRLTGAITAVLLDRLSNPGSAHIIGGAFDTDSSGAFHTDSLTDALGISPPFFGPLILSFPETRDRGGRTIFATASANIVAPNTCSGGETGSVMQAVGCSGIGREIQVHFHVPPDHRANLGIVSAQLESCGVPVPATSVSMGGTLIQMPAQSIQLNDIMGGMSGDATITIRVTDNASRITAYVSVLDNRSQDSVVFVGIPTN